MARGERDVTDGGQADSRRRPPAQDHDDATNQNHRIALYTEETIRALGASVRRVRLRQKMTLQALSSRTGLSASMLSMVERGRTSPSIGSLISIASALGLHMSELFEPNAIEEPLGTVHRLGDQPKFETAAGVVRRLACSDTTRGVELAVNHYEPGTASSAAPVQHGGVEFGVVVEGSLTIELDGRTHNLRRGDSILYDSATPHRIVNPRKSRARAVWVILDSEEQRGRRSNAATTTPSD